MSARRVSLLKCSHGLAERCLGWLQDVKFPDYRFILVEDYAIGSCVLRAEYDEKDTISGKVATQQTRSWALHDNLTKSEFVATCFKCVLTSMEHRTREWFTYRNRAIYQPHYDVDTLHSVCEERTV